MQVLFEEAGDFKAATVLSDAGASLQVELASGRRVKIKAAHVMLRFDRPSVEALLPAATKLAEELDIEFLWQCAPQEEFGYETLAAEYFGAAPDAIQSTALLLRLHGSPIHFQRKGRGQYRAAPEETVRTALASLARRREIEARIEAMAERLRAGELPAELAARPASLLVRPDKQSIEWRAFDAALRTSHLTPERLLLQVGAFDSAHALHFGCFAAEHFPAGLRFEGRAEATGLAADPHAELERADVQAFSIDDETTTEIDDALSVTPLEGGRWRIGIHIAAPALALAHDSPLDLLARERMSSVYMPGDKITMLPDPVVARYSLDAGREVAALSLYLDVSADGSDIEASHSRIERVPIAANLRHEEVSAQVTEAALASDDTARDLHFGPALRVLWRVTLASVARRERMRGKPEPRFRADFSFRIDRGPDGERVRIEQRLRDAPLDRIVAEMMILANSQWGGLLAEHEVPGIYRSQQAGRVRMSTQALPHEGLGVSQYIWATSPLRRYVDLINQRQLVALLRDQPPPLGAKDAALFSIISAFDARHTAYQDFQQRMERLWCLRWIAQEQLDRTDAVVVREDVVRLARAPFYFRLPGLPTVAPGRRIVVDLSDPDEVDLSVQARFVALSSETDTDDIQGEAAPVEETPSPAQPGPAAAA
ncbi:MAG: RNB domain-containing ribonuclease [Betaproteobacteria bacterium]|nr:RNB domain-containing ribonuclease [Betaproteobacteria bacterium]